MILAVQVQNKISLPRVVDGVLCAAVSQVAERIIKGETVYQSDLEI